MAFTVDLLESLGNLLATDGVGDYSPPWLATDVAIVIDALPASPDRAIAMSLYPVSDSAGTDSTVGVQFRIRGNKDRRSAKDTIDALFNALHDRTHYLIGITPVVRSWRQSGAYLGTDTSNRQEYTENYYLQITRSGTHRED